MIPSLDACWRLEISEGRVIYVNMAHPSLYLYDDVWPAREDRPVLTYAASFGPQGMMACREASS